MLYLKVRVRVKVRLRVRVRVRVRDEVSVPRQKSCSRGSCIVNILVMVNSCRISRILFFILT